ncbi:hypothetical protein BKH46_04280 [Helicobacter sp. 12S02634-8]|uniref:NAD(P)H-dependent oxidoreductase n=1 Tax=Helicobacter sp. 12S02634-8 TaxID=1476199 RepID=UPI000BD86105|nr:NAD(P)H-dependent oxidoreductase [Helicobacter sp. 12S02634-8]PAF47307.1 hypothetical protein BKH46_04280 [Helicobacter sp. 12S02634-8]
MEENQFIQAMNFRHACKAFDTNKQIPKEDFEVILRSGQLSPSSLGLEPTRMVVVRNKGLREAMKPLCWNQDQITSASELVVFKSLIAPLRAPSNYVRRLVSRKMAQKEKFEAYCQRIEGFLRDNDLLGENMIHWTARQAYLMASSMMNCAAFMGIDSCPIEGFEQRKLEELFAIDRGLEQIVLLVAFGYRLHPQPAEKYRLDIHELVTYQ